MHTPEQIKQISDQAAQRLTNSLVERGFKVLDAKGEGIVRNREWTLCCENGHTFTRKGALLWKKEKCPLCYTPSVEENAARLLVQAHFGKDFPNVRPSWFLSEKEHPMELDMFNEELKLAFEYNGIHHYSQIYSQTSFENVKARDEHKKKTCEALGIRLISIPRIKKNTSKKRLINYIAEVLKNNGIIIPEETQNKVIETSFVENIKNPQLPVSFQSLLNEQKFELIDGVYENRYTRLKLKHQCGKVFSTSFAELNKKIKKTVACASCNLETGEAINVYVSNGAQRKEQAEKRAKYVGESLSKQNGWIFKEHFKNIHGHWTFKYEENGELKICSKRKYDAFVKEQNIQIDDF